MPRNPWSEITAFYPALERDGFVPPKMQTPPVPAGEALRAGGYLGFAASFWGGDGFAGYQAARGLSRHPPVPVTPARCFRGGTGACGRWNPQGTARCKPGGPCALSAGLRWEQEAGDL